MHAELWSVDITGHLFTLQSICSTSRSSSTISISRIFPGCMTKRLTNLDYPTPCDKMAYRPHPCIQSLSEVCNHITKYIIDVKLFELCVSNPGVDMFLLWESLCSCNCSLMHDANSKGSALNEATHCLSPALPLLVGKQADWPRPSKGCPGIQNCRPHLAYRQK